MRSREERPTGKAKKSSKDRPKAVTLASKVKKKYSHLNATAKKRREKVGSVFTGTMTKKIKLSGGSMENGTCTKMWHGAPTPTFHRG